MTRIIFLYIIFIFSFSLEAKDIRQIQIIAKNIITSNEYIKANGNVLIFSSSYYITASRAVYNKLSQKLELYDNVNISKNNEAISLSNFAFIDMKNEINSANPVLLIDKKTDVWIDAKKIQKEKDLNIIKNATLSSCDCYNPAWSLGFANGDYNTSSNWVNTYNNTLYIKNTPAWYFLIPFIPYASTHNLLISYLIVNPPYVGFSTKQKRQSGLLRPNIGYSQSQGYIYEQPIYYAPALNYDFEYIPKIRTNRGYGNEVKYRYKDSINSKLDISFGSFKENSDYYKTQNLLNQKHYGWNIDYKKSKLFSKNDNKDGLIISLQDMNDIEYKNTLYNQENTFSDKILKSKINYFYNTNNYYADIHIEKFDDITASSNDNVFQSMPKLNFHKYSNNLFNIKNISSSLDYKFHRKTRVKGIGANINQLLLPINYNKYFFNKYLNFNFIEQLKFKHIDYTNDNNQYSNAHYLSNSHIMNFSTDLLKPYNSFIHSLNIALTLSKHNSISTKSLLHGINTNDSNLSSFTSSAQKDQATVSFNQGFYSKDSKYTLNHKITQSYFDTDDKVKKGNLENELILSIPNTSFTNRTYYNHDDKMLIKSTFDFDYKKDDFFTNIDYSYTIDKNSSTNSYEDMTANKSITGEIGTKVFKYYKIRYKNQFDITNNIVKLKEFGINISKKCWDLDLKFTNNLIASATNDEKARRQNAIYVTISLKPLVSVKQKYIQD